MRSISDLKQLVDTAIAGLVFNSGPKDLYDPINYMLALDAKRMRPVLVLCAAEMFGGDPAKSMNPALGIEVFHNFTLLHDDIMDNAPLRRTRQTVHSKWNVNVAILSGDTMFVKACQLMMMIDDDKVRPVMELFHQTAIEVCEGQQLDMDFESLDSVTIEEYIHMITNKTAVLLGSSLQTGAILASAPDSDAGHLYEFGKNIGIAFQLKDDILDVFANDKKFGKQKGGDIVANKKTFLLLKALELVSGEDAVELKKWMQESSRHPDEKIAAITRLYQKLGVKEIAESEMEKYFESAMYHLQEINVPDQRKSVLKDFAEQLMKRVV